MTDTVIIAILGSSAFTVLVNAAVELIKNQFGSKSLTAKAINFTLLSALEQYGEKLLAKGYVEPEDVNQFTEMYQLYKKRGGNGYAEKLKAEVDKLPLRRE